MIGERNHEGIGLLWVGSCAASGGVSGYLASTTWTAWSEEACSTIW
jgi:hypothetical protein